MRFQRLALILSKLWSSVRQEGITATARKVVRLAKPTHPDLFDLRYGSDTIRMEPLWRLSIESKNARFGGRYEATAEDEFAEALAMIPDPLEDFTFVDLGCGKGRLLILAAHKGFHEVIGVEFAKELVETARRNLSRLGLPGTLLHQDAAEFAFPARNLVVYMYNPFTKEVMSKVLHNLRVSLNGVAYIIYKVPTCANLFDQSGWLTSLGSPRGRNYIRVWKASTGRENVQCTIPTSDVKQKCGLLK